MGTEQESTLATGRAEARPASCDNSREPAVTVKYSLTPHVSPPRNFSLTSQKILPLVNLQLDSSLLSQPYEGPEPGKQALPQLENNKQPSISVQYPFSLVHVFIPGNAEYYNLMYYYILWVLNNLQQ